MFFNACGLSLPRLYFPRSSFLSKAPRLKKICWSLGVLIRNPSSQNTKKQAHEVENNNGHATARWPTLQVPNKQLSRMTSSVLVLDGYVRVAISVNSIKTGCFQPGKYCSALSCTQQGRQSLYNDIIRIQQLKNKLNIYTGNQPHPCRPSC